jgi:hypothetical protein
MVTALAGHCSQCHKVWTLERGQGLCQWCGKPATCQTTRTQALHSIKSRSYGRKRQAESERNGYDQLDGEWLTYYKVASKYAHRVKAQDTEDLLHTIMTNLAIADRNDGHKPGNPSWMHRIATFAIAQYWRDYYRYSNGLDCGHCSNRQRKECKQDDLYRECPKAIKIESLSKPIVGENGELSELGELIADDKALDLADWTDMKTFLAGCPQRLLNIARKRRDGEALAVRDWSYLKRFRQKEQKRLF